MYRTIVLAYEGSESSAQALRQGVELARLCKSQLHLLGIAVTTGGMAIAESVGPQDVWGSARQNAFELLARTVLDIGPLHPPVISCVRQGEPAIEIARYVQDVDADLLVLGHTGKGLFSRWFQGSVGIKLLNELPCSVLVASAVV